MSVWSSSAPDQLGAAPAMTSLERCAWRREQTGDWIGEGATSAIRATMP